MLSPAIAEFLPCHSDIYAKLRISRRNTVSATENPWQEYKLAGGKLL